MKRQNVEGGVRYGNLFFMSGVCNLADTLQGELEENFREIRDFLGKQGASLKDVISATVYLKDLNDRERVLNAIWKEQFPENPPARTCVEAGIGKCRCEIQIVAAIPE